MRVIIPEEGVGNLKYSKGYDISKDLLKEFERIYYINPISIRYTVIKRKAGEGIKEYYNRIKVEGSKGPFVSIGGDHSVSYFLYQNFPGKKILVFDAHPDLEFSTGFPTNEDWLRVLIENGFLRGRDVFLIGVRNFSPQEMDFIKENKINVLLADEIFDYNDILEFIPRSESFYVSIDIDVLDPSFSPGTFYREPFGLNPKDLLNVIKSIDILSADITEINKDFDVNNITLRLSACLSIYLWSRILGEF